MSTLIPHKGNGKNFYDIEIIIIFEFLLLKDSRFVFTKGLLEIVNNIILSPEK